MRLLPRADARLASRKGSWTICEVMPNDMREVFAGMTEQQLRAVVPASVVDEYLTDGRDGKQRKLRDYHVLLKELDRQETVLREDRETAKRHNDYMQAASKDAKQHQLFDQDERAALMAELDRAKKERAAAVAHEQSLQKELAALTAKISQLIEDNRATAEEIGRMQSEMIRQVDRRTAAVAK
jgi:chromosome segregation ATPase